VTNDYPTSWNQVAHQPLVLRDSDHRPHVRRTAKRGKWVVVEAFMLETPWGLVGAYPQYVFDQATGVRNIWDMSACLLHDVLCDHHVNLEGVLLTRKQVDMVYRWVNERSWHKTNRKLAAIRYWGVRAYDHRPFKRVQLAKPIPRHAWWMFDHLMDAEK